MKLIVFAPSSVKALDRISDPFRTSLIEAIARYAVHGSGDTKAMIGTPTVRMRVGDYRIIFDEMPDKIHVLAVGHRRDIYR